ncbi:MAG: SDR family NAD(P)-dependent oxidoreductase [Solirubrobacteraceae bacterium]
MVGGTGGRLASKTALVTGATGNIGRAIAVALAREGAYVVLSGRSAQRGGEVVDEIRRAGGRAEFVAAELDGSPSASNELAAEATRILGGRVDVLVNNARIFPTSPSSAAAGRSSTSAPGSPASGSPSPRSTARPSARSKP